MRGHRHRLAPERPPGQRAFGDHSARHLGDGGEDREDELGSGHRGADAIGEGPEPHAASVEFVDYRAEVGRRSLPSRSILQTALVSHPP